MSPEIAQSEAPVTNRCEFTKEAFLVYETAYDSFGTSNPDFEEIKDLCCKRPLSLPVQKQLEEELAAEDREDIKNALESHKEPGSTTLDDFKKELGL